MFQSGAYIMLIGMIAALVFLLPVSDKREKKVGWFQNPAGSGHPEKTGFSVNSGGVVPKTEVLERTTKNANIPDTQSAVPAKNFCTQCGSKLKAGYNFCSTCGAKI
jgi:hypothetical protein